MATRLYFRNTTVAGVTNAELSSKTATNAIAVADAKLLSTTKGAAQTSHSVSVASASARQVFLGKWISDPLIGIAGGSLTGALNGTWKLGLAMAQGNTNAGMICVPYVYVLKADGTVRGQPVGSTAAGLSIAGGSAFLGATEDGQVNADWGGTDGADVSGIVSTDRLAIEIWYQGTPSMSTSYAQTFYFDGATDVVDATTTDAASYIETSQDSLFTGPTTVNGGNSSVGNSAQAGTVIQPQVPRAGGVASSGNVANGGTAIQSQPPKLGGVASEADSAPIGKTRGPYTLAVIADGASHYWKLGESSGTTGVDQITGASNITYLNTPTLAVRSLVRDPAEDTAVTFDRETTEHVQLPNSSQAELEDATHSIEFWYRATRHDVQQSLVVFFNDFLTAGGTVSLFHENTGRISTRNPNLTGAPTLIEDGLTYHIVWTYDATTDEAKVYINGVLKGTGTGVGMTSAGAQSQGWIGSAGGTFANHVDGTIDEVAVYVGTVLSPTQILDHWTLGAMPVAGGSASAAHSANGGTKLQSQVPVLGGTATAAHTANAGSVLQSQAPVAGGRALQTDTANAGTKIQPQAPIAGGRALQTDTALAGTKVQPQAPIAGQTAAVGNVALAGTVIQPQVVGGGSAGESDAANAGTAAITYTYPQVQDADTTSGGSTSNTTGTITYPANIQAGDLLIAWIASTSTSDVSFANDGWTSLANSDFLTAAGAWGIGYKFATGSESGTFSAGVGQARPNVWRCIRITGAHSSTPPEIAATVRNAASAAPDPGSLDPSGWGIEGTLWLSLLGWRSNTITITGAPADYTDLEQGTFSTVAASLGFARRELAVSSEDPGAFTLSTSSSWCANTIAIRPGVAEPQTKAGGVASESDAAHGGTVGQAQAVSGGVAAEADTANAGTRLQSQPPVAGGRALESDTANVGTKLQPQAPKLGGVAPESDTANVGTRIQPQAPKLGGVASESDTATAGKVIQPVAGGTARENDAALAGSVAQGNQQVKAGGTALEADAANAGTAKQAQLVAGGRALQSDAANVGTKRQPQVPVAGGSALVAHSANAGTTRQPQVPVAGGRALEADAANAGTMAAPQAVAGGRATESDAALAGQPQQGQTPVVVWHTDRGVSFGTSSRSVTVLEPLALATFALDERGSEVAESGREGTFSEPGTSATFVTPEGSPD